MLFNSVQFFLFLFIVLVIYLFIPHKYKNLYLTIISIFFYSIWSFKFAILLVISICFAYIVSIKINDTQIIKKKKIYLILSIILNLSLLGFFKYFNFFVDNLNFLLKSLGISSLRSTLNIILPVGISFYTFQILGYIIDVYKGKEEARKNFFDFAIFITFFPQLLAGPIGRAGNLLPQFENIRKPKLYQWSLGFQLILWGLFKKIVIADNLSTLVSFVFDKPHLPLPGSSLALLGAYAFTIQIYCDFSGYTDIARGVAKLFGIELIKNFNLPYFATSFQDFWRRWHISLSTWLKDYLYISLGGNRSSSLRTAFNLFITMLLGGLWHGAVWTFVFWGIYHGSLLIIERFLHLFSNNTSKLLRFLHRIIVFHFVCFGWVLFRSKDINSLLRWIKMFFSLNFNNSYTSYWSYLLLYSSPIIIIWIIQAFTKRNDDEILPTKWYIQIIFILILYFGLTIFSADSAREFIYFQF
jgi:alginate O-acetyltransferase complex protein AlgI